MELFTLAVLLIALLAAWATQSLGLSLAFGAFLAGMMLGETEFRHQVESSVRPFRDVLLGLFFIGIGMRFAPQEIPPIWHWALLGALLILLSKTLIVTLLVRRMGVDLLVALRTGMLLGVGGEFGLALVAIALDSEVIDTAQGQVAIAAVLLAMVAGAVLIRFNGPLARLLVKPAEPSHQDVPELPQTPEQQVVIGGYGRVGLTIANLLHARGIPFLAFDTDPQRIRKGREEGHAVFLGDISDPELLNTIHVERASLVVLTIDHSGKAQSTLSCLKRLCPQIPVIARARDLDTGTLLLRLGAMHAYPETIEASLRLGETALQLLHVPPADIEALIEDFRASPERLSAAATSTSH